VVLLAFLLASFAVVPNKLGHKQALVAAWFLLLIAYVIGALHPGAFPYFWMTLGLFPAVAFGLSWSAILAAFPSNARGVLVATTAVLLVAVAAVYTRGQRHDTQRVQRDAMEFISRALPAGRGFHAEGALFCRADPDPFPVLFAEGVRRRFTGPQAETSSEAFIREFRTRPVVFMIAHRLITFPNVIEEFMQSHYVHYRDEVMVPGREIRGRRDDTVAVELVVSGRYRWEATSGSISIDGVAMGNGSAVKLAAGTHAVRVFDDNTEGTLVLDLREPRRPPGPMFYDVRAVREIDPRFE
jgi:hypothetical protein